MTAGLATAKMIFLAWMQHLALAVLIIVLVKIVIEFSIVTGPAGGGAAAGGAQFDGAQAAAARAQAVAGAVRAGVVFAVLLVVLARHLRQQLLPNWAISQHQIYFFDQYAGGNKAPHQEASRHYG